MVTVITCILSPPPFYMYVYVVIGACRIGTMIYCRVILDPWRSTATIWNTRVTDPYILETTPLVIDRA